MQWVADDSSVYSSIESYHILVDVCGDSASGRIPGASGWLRPERWRSNVTRLCGGSWRERWRRSLWNVRYLRGGQAGIRNPSRERMPVAFMSTRPRTPGFSHRPGWHS